MFRRTQSGEQTQLAISGALDAHTAPRLRSEVDQIVGEKLRSVVVDLSQLDFIDSSGVAVLVSLYKRVRSMQGNVTVVGVRDQPQAIFRLLHLDRVLCRT
jgi:anti-sigma B factor antagonist